MCLLKEVLDMPSYQNCFNVRWHTLISISPGSKSPSLFTSRTLNIQLSLSFRVLCIVVYYTNNIRKCIVLCPEVKDQLHTFIKCKPMFNHIKIGLRLGISHSEHLVGNQVHKLYFFFKHQFALIYQKICMRK